MIRVEHGDCREVILALPDCTVDSCVTDPPYALVSIQKRFGKASLGDGTQTSERIRNRSDGHARTAAGFMGQNWDTGEVPHDPAWWAEVYRVLKPGAHLVAFGGTRTYHRMVCAIEDAGFEIRDMCAWTYGSGFPKSHDVSKSIDKAAGAKRLIIGHQHQHDIRHHAGDWNNYGEGLSASQREGPARYADLPITAPSTEAAQHWAGWGTALKPALEPIVVARKPLSEPTIAANVLKWGTGALNIDACRISLNGDYKCKANGRPSQTGLGDNYDPENANKPDHIGRWPANLLHDNSEEVVAAFPESAGQQGDVRGDEPSDRLGGNGIYGHASNARPAHPRREGEASASRRYTEEGGTDFAMRPGARRSDAGSAARFFFSAKPDNVCQLCQLPFLDALSAESSLDRAGTPSRETNPSAPSDALACSQPENAASTQPLSETALSAASGLSPCQQMIGDCVPSSAARFSVEKIAQNVQSAANLCNSCATGIAQEFVAVGRGESVGSSLSRLSIYDSSRTILSRSLALYVAHRENTGIILTTQSLRELFGSVFHAIAENTNSAKSEPNGSSAPKRLWFSGKANRHDRWGSRHPTVKPVDLIRWLARLVTPPGGTILDPFAGSGTTAVAALAEGFNAILIEREAAYIADIKERLAFYEGTGRHSMAAKNRSRKAAPGTLL